MYLLVYTNLGIYVCKLDSSFEVKIYVCKLDSSFEVKVLDSWAIKSDKDLVNSASLWQLT